QATELTSRAPVERPLREAAHLSKNPGELARRVVAPLRPGEQLREHRGTNPHPMSGPQGGENAGHDRLPAVHPVTGDPGVEQVAAHGASGWAASGEGPAGAPLSGIGRIGYFRRGQSASHTRKNSYTSASARSRSR